MNNLIKQISEMSQKELLELKKEIEEGEIKKAIENKLEIFKNNNAVCPVCNTEIGDEGLTLTFGPKGLKQKATFDAADCLEYFIYRMRK